MLITATESDADTPRILSDPGRLWERKKHEQ
jgi:hypothetical protein